MVTKVVAKHQRRAHKLAIEPGSPHIFYSCGEDGLVQQVNMGVVSGSDCGRIFIWKKKSGKLVRVLGSGYHVTSCIESHPYAPMIATCGFDSGIEIWTPTAIDGAVLPTDIQKVCVVSK